VRSPMAQDMSAPATKEDIGLLMEQMGTFEDRMGTFEDKMGTMEDRMGTMEDRMGTMEDRMGTMEDRMGTMEGKVGSLERKFEVWKEEVKEHFNLVAENLRYDLVGIYKDRTEDHEHRIKRLERKTGLAV
jgi:archaellum component FlaC